MKTAVDEAPHALADLAACLAAGHRALLDGAAPLDGSREPFLELHRGLPAQMFARERDVGPPLARIVRRQRHAYQFRGRSGNFEDPLRELEDRELLGAAKIVNLANRSRLRR